MDSKNIAKTFIVVGVVLKEENKFLLVQEKKEKFYGKWGLPGGKVESDDTIEATACRETKEETGLDVKLIRKIDIFHESVNMPVIHIFEGKIVSGQLTFPKDELLDVKWFTKEEVSGLDLREKFIIDVLND